ncbi:hypothetical protein evm_001053 [Chilo suppressalis]|nr:hypothetical protein evm_001053 [Chilo suppressalis]
MLVSASSPSQGTIASDEAFPATGSPNGCFLVRFTQRTEALEGLKEIITSHSDALFRNLGQIILGVTPLVLNVEKVVRHESFKVLHALLSHANPENIDPFFDILSTYLRSAMTHIDARIQEDSLLFLDLLLSCTPEKVDTTHFDEIEKFKEYITTLTPLLYETWLEVCPKAKSEMNIETVINDDAASLLKYILKIISLLYFLVQHLNEKTPSSNIKQMFCQKYRQLFTQHLVNTFPYVTNVRTKQTKLNMSQFEDGITDPKMVAENLEICLLFVKLNPNINLKNHSKELTSVLSYIEKKMYASASETIKDIIINILNTIFLKENTWNKNLALMDSLFSKIIREYFNTEICKSFKQQIFSLLCKISLSDWLIHFHHRNDFKDWLKTLPNVLLEESVTVETVNILHMFAIRNNDSFNNAIKSHLLDIVDNLPKIVISNDGNPSSYHKLFSLLYWIKNWDHKSLNLLEQQLMNNQYKSDHGKYIFDTLRLRVGGIL